MWLGAHLRISEGLAESVRAGRAIGCEAIQIFSKSPHLWAAPPIAPDAAAAFRAAVPAEGMKATAVHHGYLANLASPKKATLTRSRRAFLDELQRAELLGVDGLVFHPGAHVGSGVDAGLATIAESLRKALEAAPDGKVRLLLENAAGQGTTLGSTFPELRRVLDAVGAPDRLGVCLDTCHLFASGIDLRTPDAYGRFVDRLSSELGTDVVRAFHLNDAKAPLGSHLDRHENIGRGQIGAEGFALLVRDPRWAGVPGYLETPLDEHGYDRYAEDLRVLRGLRDAPAVAPPAVSGRRREASRISTVK